jgi:hypothetical protein
MKMCTHCGGEKPLSDFAMDRSKKDGRKARCKQCDAAAKRKSYLASSPKVRSNKVIQQRNRRWREIAQAHGERWLIEQVQHLKRTGRLLMDASSKAAEDDGLAAFFREAHRTSSATLRTHLGSRLWDRVERPFMPKKEREAAMAERREQLQARLFASEITSLQWNDDEGVYEGVFEGPGESSGLTSFVEKEASDRILREWLAIDLKNGGFLRETAPKSAIGRPAISGDRLVRVRPPSLPSGAR